MRFSLRKIFAVLMCAFAISAQGSARFKKVMVVIFENTNSEDAAKEPFFAKLQAEGASFEKSFGVVHPSQGNYIALTSGDYYGVTHDNNVTLNVRHIGDLLEAKGLSWKVYAEGYPGNCFLGKSSGAYVRKHLPFLSYKNVQADAKRCSRIVDASALDADISADALPEFSLYIPDLNNDGHDTGVHYANAWYAKAFGPRLGNERFTNGLLLITTFDESESLLGPNHIYTSFFGDMVKPGAVSKATINHYSVLRTIEDNFGLGNLGKKDATAAAISDVWRP